MTLYSTNNKRFKVSLKRAVLEGLPPDNGLYQIDQLSPLPKRFFEKLPLLSFSELSFEIAKHLLGDDINDYELSNIISKAFNFPVPLIPLGDKKFILELTHGPTLAFKDFGARFMAQLMSHFNQDSSKKLTILTATSGDTGSAVANGFYNTSGTEVIILYPKDKVSSFQESQMTSLGGNIIAIEVDGSFDDCQELVKTAFLDNEIRKTKKITSANSINICRLIPQSFYYFEGYKQLKNLDKSVDKVIFSVPSGNFGNITAGLLSMKLGLPITKFLAGTNLNNTFPAYLDFGVFYPKPSVATLSNAMDVGYPSNFSRIFELEGSTWNNIDKEFQSYFYTDKTVKNEILNVYELYDYIIDPHGSIGTLSSKEHQILTEDQHYIVLETAHPYKFKNTVEKVINKPVYLDESKYIGEDNHRIKMPNSYSAFKGYLLS